MKKDGGGGGGGVRTKKGIKVYSKLGVITGRVAVPCQWWWGRGGGGGVRYK